MKPLQNVFMALALTIGFISCTKDETLSKSPEIETNNFRAIASNSLQIDGTVLSEGSSRIKVRGICWSRNPLPTVYSDTIIVGKGTGSFTGYIKNLKSDTRYYIRAYAINSRDTAYGEVKEVTTGSTVTDYEGNIYNTVKIGDQTWLVENLKTKHYRNGDPLAKAYYGKTWTMATEGAYTNSSMLGMGWDFFGNYYNWLAIHDSRNICPKGWHIPSNEEWEILLNQLQSENISSKLVLDNYTYDSTWYGATNETGFSAIPAGATMSYGEAVAVSMSDMAFWTSNETIDGKGTIFYIPSYRSLKPAIVATGKNNGYTVRCIKD